MTRPTVRSGWIVRVVEMREGLRILLHDLRSRQVHEFASWEAAFAFMRSLSEQSGQPGLR
ncbi:MAG: hypothetical protein KF813_08480 [Trueperaceae bacterium]|nr:hypothetical protein [Trueperaceae bacterium]